GAAAQPLSAAPLRQSPPQGEVVLDLPPLSDEVIANAQRLYQVGLAQGNDPDSFILIGDSNDAQSRFFQAFGTGRYTLGEYAYLQPVIDAYNATGSFGAVYATSDHGMTLSTLMDPAFVNPALCPQATSVLDCTRSEERRVGKEWRSRGAPDQRKKKRKRQAQADRTHSKPR